MDNRLPPLKVRANSDYVYIGRDEQEIMISTEWLMLILQAKADLTYTMSRSLRAKLSHTETHQCEDCCFWREPQQAEARYKVLTLLVSLLDTKPTWPNHPNFKAIHNRVCKCPICSQVAALNPIVSRTLWEGV